jgi:polyhydroxyalkanoate synthesis regulator phasin
MKRESAKGYKKTLKSAERYQTQYPTPTKAKPQPVQMQKAAKERIETLRQDNHKLTTRVTQLNRQLEEMSRILWIQKQLLTGAQ